MAHAFVIAQCASVSDLLSIVVQRHGMTQSHFHEAAPALDAMRRDEPDAIIVGCVPPLMTGQHDLLVKIARQPGLAAKTIVLTDAPDRREVAAEAHALGIPLVLPMPFDLDELGWALERLVPRATAQTNGRARPGVDRGQ